LVNLSLILRDDPRKTPEFKKKCSYWDNRNMRSRRHRRSDNCRPGKWLWPYVHSECGGGGSGKRRIF
jgi:hypothetical protein